MIVPGRDCCSARKNFPLLVNHPHAAKQQGIFTAWGNRQMRVKLLNYKIYKAESFTVHQKAATLSEADHLDGQGQLPQQYWYY
jgi:hypothetical protein